MLRTYVTDLCDYADAYVLIEGIIRVAGNAPRDRQDRPVILKNNAPFVSCITRINGELIEDAGDLDVVMPMYNLVLVKIIEKLQDHYIIIIEMN